jgi:hypothetical protein
MNRTDRPRSVHRRDDRSLPDWFRRHPTWCGVIWAGLCTAMLFVAGAADWPAWAWTIAFTVLVVPTLVATIIVLSATPRTHLDHVGSVFGHFFTRYLVLVIGFLAWTCSVVLGAGISTSLQLAAENREHEVVGIGFELVATIAPVVVGLLWIAFVLRCAWFLVRLRGWREIPATSDVPESLYRGHPNLRALVLGLAHPALLVVTGILSGVGILVVDVATIVLEIA